MIIQAFCSSFKQQLLEGVHNFRASGGHVFKMALYTELANLNSTTTTYSPDGEVPMNGNGYITGGLILTNISPSVYNNSGICSFSDAVWDLATFSARGALIYNTTPNSLVYVNPACVVLDFGITRNAVSSSGYPVFTVKMPQATDATAVIRIN